MARSCCGGNRNPSASAPPAQGEAVQQFNDNQLEMATYMSPNRGDHPVYGAATRRFYGHRRGAGVEQFLVHKADIAAQPHMFVIVSAIPSPPPEPVVAPPPPELIGRDSEDDILEGEVPPPDPVAVTTPSPEIAKKALNASKFDLQTLPGVTPNISRAMADAGYLSAEAIYEAGPDELAKKVKFLGPLKAGMIYDYIRDNFDVTD